MKKVLFILLVGVSWFSISGCESQDEADNINKAQECLDGISESNYADAESCLQYVNDYTSQQANILKCSIYHTKGGLVESKIIKAYNAYVDDTVTHKETALMAVLSIDPADATGLSTAQTADTYCQATGIAGMQYLSSLILAGTAIAKTMTDAGLSAIDTSSTSSINTAVNNLLNTCATSSPATGCDTNLQAIGTVIITLSGSYCDNESSADEGVCTQVNDAVTAAGNNATNVGQALLCYLKGTTYNSGTGNCN